MGFYVINMTTFTLIEGEDILNDIQDDFIRLYHDDNIRVPEICKKLNITKSQYQNLRMRLVRRGIITENRKRNGGKKKTRQYTKRNPRNYAYVANKKRFHVKHKGEYYACFKKEEHAQKYVKLMRECNWNKSKRLELKEKVMQE